MAVPGLDVDGGEVDAVEHHLPGVRAVEPGEDPDQGGLACAVLPHDRDVLALADGQRNALDDLQFAARVGEADVPQLHRLGRLQQRRGMVGVHRHRHEQLVVLEVGEVLVDRAEGGDQAVGRGQGAADDLLDVEELAHRLGAGDDLAHHPDQRHHLGAVLQGVRGELLGNVALLEIQPCAARRRRAAGIAAPSGTRRSRRAASRRCAGGGAGWSRSSGAAGASPPGCSSGRSARGRA